MYWYCFFVVACVVYFSFSKQWGGLDSKITACWFVSVLVGIFVCGGFYCKDNTLDHLKLDYDRSALTSSLDLNSYKKCLSTSFEYQKQLLLNQERYCKGFSSLIDLGYACNKIKNEKAQSPSSMCEPVAGSAVSP